jgi:hypothetical protein
VERFNFDDDFYRIFGFFCFFEEIANSVISIVFIGSYQIFITINLSCRRGEQYVFSVFVDSFSTILGSEIFVVDCSDDVFRSNNINEFFGREGDIENELSCLVKDLEYWAMRSKADFYGYLIFEGVFDVEFSGVWVDFCDGLIVFRVKSDVIV